MLPKEVKDLLVPGADTVKAIGTADSEGTPHTIITGSLTAIDDETLAFAVVATKTTVNYPQLKQWASCFDDRTCCDLKEYYRSIPLLQ